ncbi:MAG: hypothetical protein ACP5NF_03395 [Thermoanaerobaculum sp.]
MNGKVSLSITCLLAVFSQAQVPPRPPWAEGIPAFAALEPAWKDSDLARLAWQRFFVACGGEKRLFVLDPQTGKLLAFDFRGNLRDASVVRNWQPRDGGYPWGGLACTPRGDRLVFWKKNEVVVFTPEAVEKELPLPVMAVTDLVLAGEALVTAVVPAIFRTDRERRGFDLDDTLLRRFDLAGAEKARWLAPEPVERSDPFAAAVANEVALASNGKLLLVVPQHRHYRVLAMEGEKERWRWQADKLAPKPSEQKPTAPPEELAPEAVPLFRPLDLPFTVRDVTVSGGFLWVFLAPAVIEGNLVVDVFPVGGPAPVARIKLNHPQPSQGAQLFVGRDGIWVVPFQDGSPTGFVRPPMRSCKRLANKPALVDCTPSFAQTRRPACPRGFAHGGLGETGGSRSLPRALRLEGRTTKAL